MKVCIIGDGLASLTLANVLINRDLFVDIFTSKKKDLYDQNDMNDIMVAKDVTGKNFKKNTFLYDFFSSMRQKINDPLGQRAKKRKEISQR